MSYLVNFQNYNLVIEKNQTSKVSENQIVTSDKAVQT